MSKDIILSSNNSKLYFKYLDWDSKFFNKKSYLIDFSRSKNLKKSKNLRKLIKENFKDSFVSMKIPTNKVELISFFQECGFKFIDEEVILKNSKIGNKIDRADLVFREEKRELNFNFKELSSVFQFSRFHNDSKIKNRKADLLWEEHFNNFKISKNNRAFVVEKSNEVAGTVLVKIDGNSATLFIVSVKEKFRNKNIGSYLISNTIQSLENYEIFTETQVKNIEALNFYIKNGFTKIERTLTVMHRWS